MARTYATAKAPRLCPAQPSGNVRFASSRCTCSITPATCCVRVLFVDCQGHISAVPHFLPRSEALILAANQPHIEQRFLGV